MRTIKELLEIMLAYYEKPENGTTFGLCKVVNSLRSDEVITQEEEDIITYYMGNNKPVTSFYTWENEVTNEDYKFWYQVGVKPPRIEWLNEHIELNTNTNEKL